METSVNITLKGESRYPRLSFISIHDPNESKRPAERKAVRSHAAFYHHNIDKATQDSASKDSKSNIPTANSKARRRKRRRDIIIPLEVRDANPADRDMTHDDGTKRQAEVFEKLARQILRPVNRVIGQGRNDPFQTYPVPWEPIIPELVDHYLVHMAVDMPELDEPGKSGLLRTRWFPLVMTEAATFQVVILIAASHFSSLRYPQGNGPNLLQMKSKAIASINEALRIPSQFPSDQLIGAVAKMASYEAMFGDQATFEMHMMGLLKMVQLRGGLTKLGLQGMLARICVWIDCNSAFLHNSQAHFEISKDEVYSQANPSGFLGAH